MFILEYKIRLRDRVYLFLSLEIAAEMVNCSEFINVAVRLKKFGDKLGRRQREKDREYVVEGNLKLS